MAQSERIGLMADSHDNKGAVGGAVEMFNTRGVGTVLHAGDYIAPFNARWMAPLKAPMVGVFGNNDGERFGLCALFEPIGTIHRGPHVVERAGRRILLMHEPDELDALAASGAYDAIVYGHTHAIDVRPGPTLIINPGEAGGWMTDRSTVAVLDLETMEPEVVDL
ncbi:MAG: metallophosphoesterase [Candidatus Latescibacteria bacterium]|jgi:hypothetical protein|nr:metallophosphoesterase [Candidatus Latescibacterota bacterium]